MTDNPLLAGALVAFSVAGAYLWLEIGRYAEPQVPTTYFQERRLAFAFTVGLAVGTPAWILYLLFATSLIVGGAIGAVAFLVGLIVVLEAVQWGLARSAYFGADAAVPFYALAYRAGVAGLMGVALVSEYLSVGTITVLGVVGTLLTVPAFLLLLVAVGIQTTPTGAPIERRSGELGRGVLLEAVGFLLLGVGAIGGDSGPILAAAVVAVGSLGLYRGRRAAVFETARPAGESKDPATAPPTGRFGRRDRKGSD